RSSDRTAVRGDHMRKLALIVAAAATALLALSACGPNDESAAGGRAGGAAAGRAAATVAEPSPSPSPSHGPLAHDIPSEEARPGTRLAKADRTANVGQDLADAPGV